MKNKIITLLIGMCIGGLLYGCNEVSFQNVQAKDIAKFDVLFDEDIAGNSTYVIKDNEYNHEYIVISKPRYDGGIGIVERDTK